MAGFRTCAGGAATAGSTAILPTAEAPSALHGAGRADHRRMRHGFLVSVFALVVLAGAWFGVFACRGHAWQRDAFKLALGAALVVGVVGRALPGSTVWRRLGWCALLLFTNHVVEVTASCFSAGSPRSWSEASHRVARRLQRGAC